MWLQPQAAVHQPPRLHQPRALQEALGLPLLPRRPLVAMEQVVLSAAPLMSFSGFHLCWLWLAPRCTRAEAVHLMLVFRLLVACMYSNFIIWLCWNFLMFYVLIGPWCIEDVDYVWVKAHLVERSGMEPQSSFQPLCCFSHLIAQKATGMTAPSISANFIPPYKGRGDNYLLR